MGVDKKPQPLQVVEVESFLRNHLGAGIKDVVAMGKGDWSQAFALQHGDTPLIARFGAYGEDYTKDRYAYRFAVPDLPIPRVQEIGQALGRYFCLSERGFGEMLDGLDAAQMQAIVPAVLRMLDALRDADLGATVGYGGWGVDGNGSEPSWHGFLREVDSESERVHGWHAAMAESPTGSAPFAHARKYLWSHLELCPEARHLLHTDLLHFNVLVAGDAISAVVDWGNALYGDFLYELAGFTFYTPWYPAMANIDWRMEALRHYGNVGLVVPHFDERMRCYEAHIGMSGMAYSAFTQRWGDLADHAARTLHLLHKR